MAIDITNQHIGIALAYYRRQSTPPASIGSDNDDTDTDNNIHALIATSITPLPPLPYMSNRPYHPSYAFLHHHQPDGAHNMPRCLDRFERTIEVADQLAQLAINRQVRGIVVRWPGELASTVAVGGGGNGELSTPKSTREVDEGNLLYSTTTAIRNVGRDVGFKNGSDGTMGYMRGRILYLLDKCCTRHGHAQTNVHNMEPLLMEGSRPFALFDTSVSERDWIVRKQPTDRSSSSRQNDVHQFKFKDKYGNSVAEVDLWGRCPIFGNQPPRPQQGKFYYSSMESSHSDYTVSSHFELGNDCGNSGREAKQSNQNNLANFDGLHENESRIHQFYGSLSAMHTLCDFAKEHLQGRIVLPVWASTSYSTAPSHTTTGMSGDECNDLRTTSRPDNGSSHSSTSSNMQLPLNCEQSKGAVTLAQLPIRKVSRRSKR